VEGPDVFDLARRWQLDVAALLPVVLAAVLYALGVRRLAARGRRWPRPRSLAWAAGLAAVVVATNSGVGRFEGERLTVHMVQHTLLGMTAPLLLVLAAPVTLVLQAARPAGQRVAVGVLHGRVVRTLTRPVVGWCLFGGGLVALYLTPLLDVAARNDVVHLAVHAHVLVSASLFLLPLVGTDVLPRPLTPPARLLAVLAAVPFHAFLGVALLSARNPVAPEAYPSLGDQRTAAGILMGAGELLTFTVAAIVARRWVLADRREAARADRRDDARRVVEPAGSGGDLGSG
jgi:putative copper resistance protein D